MYFLYFLILCSTSSLLTPVNSYVVIAANLNDFRTIAKKFVPKDLVNQIKALVLEKGHKHNREPSKYDEQVNRFVEYEGISKHDENSYELAAELKAALGKQLTNGYKLKKAPKVAFVESIRSPQVTQVAAPAATVLTVNEIVQKVKDKLLKEFFESGHALGNTLADKMQSVGSQVHNNVIYNKYATPAKAKGPIRKPVYNSVPMKVIKEEVQFEASYEDTDDKPLKQYYSEYYKPILNKSTANNNNYPFIYAKNTIPQKSRYDGSKKVRFVKQVLVPAHSNQGQPVHVSQSHFVKQTSLPHQSNIVPHSNLELHLSSHQGSIVQQPLHQHSNIAQQLALMQQQINQLTKNAQDHGLKKKTALESPHLNIEAIDAHFHILPHPTVKEDKNKTNESQKDQDEPTEETLLSEKTTAEPVTTETSTKASTEPIVENEQFVEEEGSAVSVENEEGGTKNKPEEINSNEDEHAQADSPIMREVKVDNNARAGSKIKVHTKEFGKPNAGEPIVEKTYNFEAPTNEADVSPEDPKKPVSSARKVMLF